MSGFRTILYGQPKNGVSTLCLSLPDVYCFNLSDSLPPHDPKLSTRITSFEQLNAFISKIMCSEKKKIKNLVFDNLLGLECLVKDYVARKEGVTYLESIEYGKGHFYAMRVFLDFLSKLNELMNKAGINIYIAAGANFNENSKNWAPLVTIVNAKSESTLPYLLNWADIVGYVSLPCAEIDNSDEQYILLQPNRLCSAGNRLDLVNMTSFEFLDFLSPKEEKSDETPKEEESNETSEPIFNNPTENNEKIDDEKS